MFSSAFHINFILKLAPVLSRIAGNAVGAHFLQLYCKNEHCDPHFLFRDFDKNSASFNEKKNWQKSVFEFLAILTNCTD